MQRLRSWKGTRREISLAQWLGNAFRDNNERMVDDVHFDELRGPWDGAQSGQDWIPLCCDLLREVVEAVPRYDNLAGVRVAVVALPVGLSERIKLWKDSYWRKAGLGYEPPSLVLMKNNAFDETFDEQYSRALQLPKDLCPNMTAVFRSYRDSDVERPVEFGNVIFIAARLPM